GLDEIVLNLGDFQREIPALDEQGGGQLRQALLERLQLLARARSLVLGRKFGGSAVLQDKILDQVLVSQAVEQDCRVPLGNTQTESAFAISDLQAGRDPDDDV